MDRSLKESLIETVTYLQEVSSHLITLLESTGNLLSEQASSLARMK